MGLNMWHGLFPTPYSVHKYKHNSKTKCLTRGKQFSIKLSTSREGTVKKYRTKARMKTAAVYILRWPYLTRVIL